ncbi:MalY/PatB family protein [Lactobacillus sp. ESL0681]|uniref:MalY/PatB family protein n=1 Tax=Lactobacillus sp. ESL0681 TaxID=2983211 RepID=UPI0023F982B6|nr:MalY/PatB family protein [Lactobacillus sp. ESL0681]WEV41226.1 pyridoxal phosphate-dependent aminotransferase [Lactobacillus sp. ESL0681]
MEYDFTTIIPRRQTNSVKWNVDENELPMSLADMDFAVAPEIVTAMKEKLDLGVFGYEIVPDTYYEALINWFQGQHHTKLEKSWLMFVNGVIPALSSIVRSVTNVGDSILVQAPVYDIFYHSIENNGRHTLTSDLVYQNYHYEIDWTDLAAKLAQPLTTMMILCNPHNPVGKTWTKAELERLVKLCTKYHVKLVSDEIHGDLVWGQEEYIPLAALANLADKEVVSLTSPSKAFNVAALHAATVIIPNENLRNQISRGLNNDELTEPNLLAIPGSIAAYTKADEWLNGLKKQLTANYYLAEKFIMANIPEVKITSGQATYLMWLDVSAYTNDSQALADFIRRKTGLVVAAGAVYRGNGSNFLRLNFACPSQMLLDGLQRLQVSLTEFKKEKNYGN